MSWNCISIHISILSECTWDEKVFDPRDGDVQLLAEFSELLNPWERWSGLQPLSYLDELLVLYMNIHVCIHIHTYIKICRILYRLIILDNVKCIWKLYIYIYICACILICLPLTINFSGSFLMSPLLFQLILNFNRLLQLPKSRESARKMSETSAPNGIP